MRWLRSIGREVAGLFVDDGSFAVAILVWLAVVLVLGRVVAGGRWLGCGLFVGLAMVLVESLLRFARRRSK
jgi:hypothetical protein